MRSWHESNLFDKIHKPQGVTSKQMKSWFSPASVLAVGLLAGWMLAAAPPSEAQCLDRTACREIAAEIDKLKPELRLAKKTAKKARRLLGSLRKGSDEWKAAKAAAQEMKKGFKALRRELRALKQDARHQGCGSC